MKTWIFETMKNFFVRFGIGILVVFLAGTALSFFVKNAWREVENSQPEISAESLSNSAGTGIALATIGGFRTVLADISWLRAFHFWTKKDANSCENCMKISRTLDPQNYFFWENSVNSVAYDFPAWTISARGGNAVSEQVQAEIHRKAFENSKALFAEMEKRFPGEGKVFTFEAQLTLIKTAMIAGMPDFEQVLALYKKAMEAKSKPWFSFFAYANITKEHFPERVPEAKKYFRERLESAKSPELKRILEDALADLE